MRGVETVHSRLQAPAATGNPRSDQRWLRYSILSFAVLVIICFLLLVFNWPFTKQGVINALQESSIRYVTVDHFRKTFFPPGCVAEGVKFLQSKQNDKPPLITIRRLTTEGSYARMLTFQKRLSLVRVDGMHVTVPPESKSGTASPVMPVTQAKRRRPMNIGTVIADGAVLDFLSSTPGQTPFHLIVNKLALDGVGSNQPLSYRATIINPEPPGEIQSSGRFGPWNPRDPGRTAVTGSYTMRYANLAFFSAISGTLFSKGRFSGTLDHIEIAGTTDTPNFKVSSSSHEQRLTTEFHAAVDATDGNTFLENVIGHFDRTTLAATGRITGENGKEGKLISADVFAAHGRIEDLLDLFITAKRPPMTGDVNFGAHVEVPPENEPFLQKLKLVGDFGIGGGKFMNAHTQGDIGRLSESAEKAEKDEKGEAPENPATVVSNLKGHVAVQDGIATLSNLSFSVPGAFARMHGTYSLIDYRVDLHGTLVTRGKVSKATTGFKSLLVEAISPLFKRRASLKIVPFRITGSYRHTMVALDLGPKQRKHHRARRIR